MKKKYKNALNMDNDNVSVSSAATQKVSNTTGCGQLDTGSDYVLVSSANTHQFSHTTEFKQVKIYCTIGLHWTFLICVLNLESVFVIFQKVEVGSNTYKYLLDNLFINQRAQQNRNQMTENSSHSSKSKAHSNSNGILPSNIIACNA
jgi:hypothetical protein